MGCCFSHRGPLLGQWTEGQGWGPLAGKKLGSLLLFSEVLDGH